MYIQNISDTMTTEEYLRKKEQEELDKLFDNLKPLEVSEEDIDTNNLLAKEVSKLFDLEANLGICEELYLQGLKSDTKTADEIKSMANVLKATKIQYTKQKNKLDKMIKEMK